MTIICVIMCISHRYICILVMVQGSEIIPTDLLIPTEVFSTYLGSAVFQTGGENFWEKSSRTYWEINIRFTWISFLVVK